MKKLLSKICLVINLNSVVLHQTKTFQKIPAVESELGTSGINLPSTSKIQIVLYFFFKVKVQVQVIGEYIFTKYKYKYVANTFQLLFNYFSNTFNK